MSESINAAPVSRMRQLAAAGIAMTGIIGTTTACTPEQVQMSMDFCKKQPNYEQCLGNIAAASQIIPGLSHEASAVINEMNDTLAPSDDGLYRLRTCESTDRYNITNKSGKYMGAYQFDQRTWNGAAQGNGLVELVNVKPHHAPPEAQDALARAVFEDRGRSPWPECGKRI